MKVSRITSDQSLSCISNISLRYSLKENSNLRLSYSKTTARPSFKEVSIAEIYDPLSNMTFNGNINLKPSYIDNLDLRYELFGEDNELFAISGFYKSFKDPIELTYYEASTENFQPKNLGNAKVYGLELELRKQISQSLGINLNASIIESRQQYGSSELSLRTKGLRDGESLGTYRNLQGQSPFLINSSLDKNLCASSRIPCTAPQSTKFHDAPCHKPPRSIVPINATTNTRVPPLLPPSGI